MRTVEQISKEYRKAVEEEKAASAIKERLRQELEDIKTAVLKELENI